VSPDAVKLLPPMVGIFPKKYTSFNFVQPLKAEAPIVSIKGDIVAVVKPVQPLKAKAHIDVIGEGIVIVVSP
jgi:hypothetical protein